MHDMLNARFLDFAPQEDIVNASDGNSGEGSGTSGGGENPPIGQKQCFYGVKHTSVTH